MKKLSSINTFYKIKKNVKYFIKISMKDLILYFILKYFINLNYFLIKAVSCNLWSIIYRVCNSCIHGYNTTREKLIFIYLVENEQIKKISKFKDVFSFNFFFFKKLVKLMLVWQFFAYIYTLISMTQTAVTKNVIAICCFALLNLND